MDASEKKRRFENGDCSGESSPPKKLKYDMNKSESKNENKSSEAGDNEVWSDTEEWDSIAEAAEQFVSNSQGLTGDGKTTLQNIASVQRDSKVVAAVFSNVDPDIIYEKIKDKRTEPNRVEIVTNQILENGLGELSNSDSKMDSSGSPTKFSSDEEINQKVTHKVEPNKNNHKESVLKVFGKLQDENPNIQISFSEISLLLQKNYDKNDHINYVTWLIVSGNYKKSCITDKYSNKEQTGIKEQSVPSTSSADIFQDVKSILSKFPKAIPDEVYSLLEAKINSEDRVTEVINVLNEKEKGCNKPSLEKSDSLTDDPRCVKDPLYRDMRVIHKVFPDRDPNEIYAHLEAHHDKSNRLDIIIDQFMKMNSQEVDKVDASIQKDTPSSDNKGKQHIIKEDPIVKIQRELEELKDMFPDCDPNYLFNELENRASDPDGTKRLVQEMIERKNYPKLKETLETQKKVIKRTLSDMEFNFDEFMQKFPDALTYFYNLERLISNNYKDHCLVFIQNKFPRFKLGFIREVLAKYDHHLAPAYKEFEEVATDLLSRRRNSKKLRIQERDTPAKYPDDLDELFANEKLFIEHEEEIKAKIREKEELRALKIEEARKNKELFECACCFDDECLFEDLMACGDGHLFCKDCVQRSSEGIIGQGKAFFPCLGADCEHAFPLSVLQNVLTAKNFSILLRRLQEEEIRQAEIPDLVSCPFCSFATIMPNENDKVFKCLNPECLKESCRLCKEPSHIPLRCEEVEKQGETNMRTYIENKISEAMLRICPKCKKRFVKEYGCNKMTCVCGETMCYVCRASGIDYDHFNGQNSDCAANTDMVALHKKEMEEAAKKAKEKYLEEHPEASDVTLKYDPFSHIKDMQNKMNNPGFPLFGNPLFGNPNLMHYDEDDDDDDEESDSDYDEDEEDTGEIYYF